MKKISIIGHFSFRKETANGQTIKTRIIADELLQHLGGEDVLLLDTSGGKRKLLTIPFTVLKALRKSKNVVILPAHNGVRVIAPLLVFFNRFFHRKLHYVVIGGWLPQFLESRKRLAKILKRYDGIYVETNTMKSALEAQGFENVYVMPNCKKLTALTENELIYQKAEPYKFCTFSRVMKEKGIEDAVKAVKAINDHFKKVVCTLDIYGQVDSTQKEWFEDLKQSFPEYVAYGGVVPFDKSVEILKEYFALLFPTYYEGEGFAGTLIDAYSAGIPVIASSWKYNSELVNENVGYVYPARDQDAFVELLKSIVENPEAVNNKKKLCLKETDKYRIDKVIMILLDRMEID